MRKLAAFLTLLLLTACSSGSGPNNAQTAITNALVVLATGINAGDPILASQPVGEQFFLGANVASRYTVDWDPNEAAPAVGRFRTFFNTAFSRLANEHQQFTTPVIQVNGSVATVVTQARFDAVRTDSTPAENVTYTTTDYMLFELQNGSWRLVRWDEQPPAA